MEIQTLNEVVLLGITAAAPMIMFVVEVVKIIFKVQSKYSPYVAGAVGMIAGIALSVDVAGADVMTILVGAGIGITGGFAAVGAHNTFKKKRTDESEAMLID